jgi:hypothetical protein
MDLDDIRVRQLAHAFDAVTVYTIGCRFNHTPGFDPSSRGFILEHYHITSTRRGSRTSIRFLSRPLPWLGSDTEMLARDKAIRSRTGQELPAGIEDPVLLARLQSIADGHDQIAANISRAKSGQRGKHRTSQAESLFVSSPEPAAPPARHVVDPGAK